LSCVRCIVEASDYDAEQGLFVQVRLADLTSTSESCIVVVVGPPRVGVDCVRIKGLIQVGLTSSISVC
jgi:hypothetical protein